MIYLDYSATTPVNDEVLDTFVKVTKKFIGNPNSLHRLGMEAKDLISAATKQIEDILNISDCDILYRYVRIIQIVVLICPVSFFFFFWLAK